MSTIRRRLTIDRGPSYSTPSQWARPSSISHPCGSTKEDPSMTRNDLSSGPAAPEEPRGALDELFERKLDRGTALRGLGGVVAAGALGGLTATPALARRTTRKATTITMWANHPEWKTVLDGLVKDFQASHPSIQVQIDYKPNA